MAVAQYYGTGRRKTSVARVRLVPGQGKITVNKKELTEYFGRKTLELIIKQPLVLAGVTEQYDVIADVKGGGPSGQAGAIRHGISRALLEVDVEFRQGLKKASFAVLETLRFCEINGTNFGSCRFFVRPQGL